MRNRQSRSLCTVPSGKVVCRFVSQNAWVNYEPWGSVRLRGVSHKKFAEDTADKIIAGASQVCVSQMFIIYYFGEIRPRTVSVIWSRLQNLTSDMLWGKLNDYVRESRKISNERRYFEVGFPGSNRGPAYTAKIFKEVNVILSIVQRFTAAYHLHSNAFAERVMNFIAEKLTAKQDNWTQTPPYLIFVILRGIVRLWKSHILIFGSEPTMTVDTLFRKFGHGGKPSSRTIGKYFWCCLFGR